MSAGGRRRQRGPRARDGGAVLVVVLLVMVVLLSLGMTAVWLTGGNLQVASGMNQRSQALYCAQAGIERARSMLLAAPRGELNEYLSQRLGGTAHIQDDIPRGLDANGKPDGVGAILADPTPMAGIAFPPTSFGRSAGSAEAPVATEMGRYTVWIRNDLAECRQGDFTIDRNAAVVIRSQCVAVDGRSTVVLEATFVPPITPERVPVFIECLDTGKNVDDANTNTLHCTRGN